MGPLTYKPSVYLRVSGIFGARITCIFANILDICKSHNSGPKGEQISWIFLYHLEILNLLDNLECPGYSGSMNCKSTGYSQLIKNKSPGYSGPMKFESYGSLPQVDNVKNPRGVCGFLS